MKSCNIFWQERTSGLLPTLTKKKQWPKLLLVVLVFFAFLLLWYQQASLRYSSVSVPTTVAYTLFSQDDITFADRILQLPENDYHQLIDLKFNYSMINFICNEIAPILLLILVHSGTKNFDKRQTIRATWGKNEENIKILFMLGSTRSDSLQKRLEEESKLYNDCIQGSFVDTYRNLTYKHVMSLKYFVYHCPQAKFVLKTDDDLFVNIPTVKKFLVYGLSPHGASKGLFCLPRYNEFAIRSYRLKWRVSFKEYPERSYPTFCPGWTLLYTPDVAFALYKEAQKSEYFWLDDVYITGILAKKLNFTHTNIRPLVLSHRDVHSIVNNNSYNLSKPFLYGGPQLEEKDIRLLWNLVVKSEEPKFIIRNVVF